MAIGTIEEYLQSINAEGKTAVQNIIDFMRDSFPEIHPKICYSMPMWLAGKKMKQGYVAVSAAKSHYSVHFSSEQALAELISSTTHCKSGKRCINIPYGKDSDLAIIEDYIVRFLNHEIQNIKVD